MRSVEWEREKQLKEHSAHWSGADVGGWYIAMGQYSSLCEGALVNSLDAVDIGEEVLVRVQVG